MTHSYCKYVDGHYCIADDELMRLRAENEALKQDAERYRWLKDQDWVTWKPYGLAFKAGAAGTGLDYTVDAYRLTEQHNAALRGEGEK